MNRQINNLIRQDPEASLSDVYDYEPALEFDDTDMHPPPDASFQDLMDELFPEEAVEPEIPVSDTYYDVLSSEMQDNYNDLDNAGWIHVGGDDAVGCRVIVVSACNIPNKEDVSPERLLRHLMHTLEGYVEQDYTIIYFHNGLTKENMPSMKWLWEAFKALDRKYKKNIKNLFIVHPTLLIKVVYNMLRPLLSIKFGKKIKYVNYLHELAMAIDLSKLYIPSKVQAHNQSLLSKSEKVAAEAKKVFDSLNEPLPSAQDNTPKTQQFGVSLQFIKENNPETIECIPPVVRACVEYLSHVDALEAEGIFRRSASIETIKELVKLCNSGDPGFLNNILDPHCVAVLLKTFFKELPEPLLTFELYETVTEFLSWPRDERISRTQYLLLSKVPIENYKVLNYIIVFLNKVASRSGLNKMSIGNLAIVFGPNFLWPASGQINLNSIKSINAFTEFMLQNYSSVFLLE